MYSTFFFKYILTCRNSSFRYIRLWVNLFAYFHYKPELPPDNPSVSSQDVTVIIPTLAVDLKQLMETVESACKLEPSEIILVAA